MLTATYFISRILQSLLNIDVVTSELAFHSLTELRKRSFNTKHCQVPGQAGAELAPSLATVQVVGTVQDTGLGRLARSSGGMRTPSQTSWSSGESIVMISCTG